MPRSSSASKSRHPGPLKDLPLERFLPPDPNLPSASKGGMKRALSPAMPSLFSPTKRRILVDEGIFSGSSVKTPARLRALPVGSPVKKLDLGLGSPHGGASSSLFLSSPRTTRRSSALDAARTLSSAAPALVPGIDSSFPVSSSSSSSAADFIPGELRKIPREVPPAVDPQSVHYPGFVVCQDAYVLVGPVAPMCPPSPQKDEAKENAPPRRAAKAGRKSTSTDSLVLGGDLSTKTPRPAKLRASLTPTPRRVTRSSHTPVLPDEERKALRRMMEEEADGNQTDDDDEMILA